MDDDTTWSGFQMTVGRSVARAAAVALAMLVVFAVGFTTSAMAAPPQLAITQPLTGTQTNNPALLLSGTSNDPLDSITLKIYAGASATGTIVQEMPLIVPVELGLEAATWAVTLEPALEQGQYTAAVEQTNLAAEVGASEPVTFTIDTTPPAVTINTVASPTNNPQPTLSGAAGVAPGDEAGVTVTIYQGATASGTIAASGSVTEHAGTWSYTPSHLADGEYTAQAIQSDEAGNLGTTAAVTFTIDTTPPAVTINAPQSPTKDSTPTLTGGVGTAPGDLEAVSVTIHEGTLSGKTVATGSAGVTGASWSYTAPHLADGTYVAQAMQKDDAGNLGTSGAVTFTIDTTPPAVSINAVPAYTKNTEPSLSGGVGRAIGDIASVTVNIYDGAVAGGALAASGPASVNGSSWSYTAPHLADGIYTAQASQSDDVGNLGTSAAVTFTVDTKAPAVSINTLASPTDHGEPTLTGGAGVEAGDEASVTVAIHEGTLSGRTVAVGPATVTGSSWSYTAPHLADGTYIATATQKDQAGNIGTSSQSAPFVIDTTPPLVSLTAPANHVSLDGPRPTFSGAAGTALGDLLPVTLRIYAGGSTSGKLEHTETIESHSGHWTTGADGPALANGEYTAIAEQSDDAGNVGKSHTVTFTITTVVTLDTARFVQREGGLFTGPTPSFDGTAGTAPGDGNVIVVKIFSGSYPSEEGLVATLEAQRSAGGTWAVGPVPALTSGTYTVQAEQEGSPASIAEAVFTVDAQAPNPTITVPANNSSTASSTPALSGSAGTAAGDQSTITTHLYAGASTAGALLQTVKTEASAGVWAATLAALSPGTYTVQAEQSDDVGNTGQSEPVTFTVTQVVPPSTQPAPPAVSFKWLPGAPNAGEPVTLISTSTDISAPITGYAWAAAGNGVFAPGESSLTTTFATPGEHVVQLRVTDASGGSSVAAETIPVSTAPVPLMQPFPVVRMAGSFNATGAKISVLTVLAPVGAKVSITCHGPHCPAKSQAVLATAGAKSKAGTDVIAFRRFERSLRGGVVLEIWVSKPGEIGKFTRFTIRRGKSPSRVDECLNPAGTTPIVCPS